MPFAFIGDTVDVAIRNTIEKVDCPVPEMTEFAQVGSLRDAVNRRAGVG
jgi:hypothetical protein